MRIKIIGWLILWFVAAGALLWFGELPGDVGHSIYGYSLCGHWGCLPPLQALVAMHGLWILVLLPFVAWAARTWRPIAIRIAGYSLLGLGILAIAGQCVHELLTWYMDVPADLRRYIWQRMAYALACNTDLPAVQMLVAGVVLLFVARKRGNQIRLGTASKCV
ncbi:MAG: hypothetical protein HY040_08575 [Planctomycetes bacterium]|nr:hypothetical protein [Planctomycetota bacterium]